MKYKINIILAFSLVTGNCFGQHVEYNFGAGSGFFHYASDKSDKIEPYFSMLNIAVDSIYRTKPYANNPRGEKSGFSFQFFADLKK
jgi:hypothetical protein